MTSKRAKIATLSSWLVLLYLSLKHRIARSLNMVIECWCRHIKDEQWTEG